MGEPLLSLGLERFVVGDFAGAGRLWLAAQVETPDDPQLRAYLEHLREVSPATMAELETVEAGGGVDPADIEAAAASLLEVDEMPPPPVEVPLAPPPVEATAASPPDPWTDGAGTAAPMQVDSKALGLDLVHPIAVPSDPKPGPVPELGSGSRLPSPSSLLARMRKLMSVDNFSGALELAQLILGEDPEQAEARHAAAHCCEHLEQMYLAKIGDLTVRPRVRLPPGEVIWLDLDHRSGFVLAQVDGASSYEEIVELTGMARLETLRILCSLGEKGVIGNGVD